MIGELIARLLCRWFGHNEETSVASWQDTQVVVHGCTRCDRVLSLGEYHGSYPLPRRSA